jgi:hypothetical protein
VWLVGRFASRPVPKDAADWAVNTGGPHAFLASICSMPNAVGRVSAEFRVTLTYVPYFLSR